MTQLRMCALVMWDKRQRGYRAMGYRIVEHPQQAADLLTGTNSEQFDNE